MTLNEGRGNMLKISMAFGAAALASLACSYSFAASVDDARLGSSTGYIIDSTGARWTLNGGNIYVNGVRDVHAYNVICLAYEDGRMWQENSSHHWWEKTKPTDTWAPSGGTSNSPLPPITATVANGYMKIRTDPQTVVGITAGSTNNSQGSTSVVTDNFGNVSIALSSLFGSNTYLVSEFRKPMLLSRYADVAMLSFEKYYIAISYYCCQDNYSGDLQATYGPNATLIDWTTLVSLQAADPAAFTLFAQSLGSDDAFVLYNGAQYDNNYRPYVIRTYTSATTITSISNSLYLDVSTGYFGRLAYHNFGQSSYSFNTVGSVSVVVP